MKQGVRFSGFRRVAVVERAARIAEATGCGKDEITAALHRGGLEARAADKIVENVLGTYALPYGVVLHMRVNGRDRVVPVAVEEPSVVAAASSAAKMALAGGGFHADADASWMIGQIQLVDVRDPVAAAMRVLEHKSAILAIADAAVPGLVRRGGGVRDVEARILGEPAEDARLDVAHSATAAHEPRYGRVGDRADRRLVLEHAHGGGHRIAHVDELNLTDHPRGVGVRVKPAPASAILAALEAAATTLGSSTATGTTRSRPLTRMWRTTP